MYAYIHVHEDTCTSLAQLIMNFYKQQFYSSVSIIAYKTATNSKQLC